MAQLSRKQRYQDLRDKIDEDSTSASRPSVSFPRPYGDIDYTQSDYVSQHAVRSIHSHQKPEAKAQMQKLPKSEVMSDLLVEVKQYNIDNGDRLDDDTQLNILRTLDSSQEQLRRSAHIVPMEEEEKGGCTMRIEKSVRVDSSGPAQKLTRINPIPAAPAPEEPAAKKPETEEPAQKPETEPAQEAAAPETAPEATQEKIVLTNRDILAGSRKEQEKDLNILGFDDEMISFSAVDEAPREEKKRSLFSRRKKAEKPSEQPPVPREPAMTLQDEPEEEDDTLSILFEKPFVQEEKAAQQPRVSRQQEAEAKPAGKQGPGFFTAQNILILVLIVVLLCSIALTVYILMKSGIL